jgi:N-acetylneuraminic acid mutarotase
MKTECTPLLTFLKPRVLIGFALYAAGLVLVFGATSAVGGDNAVAELSASGPAQATGGTWTVTGDLHAPRADHTATLLPDGKVLVAGGGNDDVNMASAQLYHPAIGMWERIGNMNHRRRRHTATLLRNGQVLVTCGTPCGANCPPGPRGSAELYDPIARTWTDTGRLPIALWYHTATLLPNGQVLVAGGIAGDIQNPGENQTGAELYDPATGIWTATGSMSVAHSHHTATLLPSGQVLVAGGYSGSNALSAELYDPATGVWTATRNLPIGRWDHTATLLPNGQVLVVGGVGNNFSSIASAELYDPATRSWTETGSMVHERSSHTATLLSNGQVLVAGGEGVCCPFPFWTSAELYDPATGTWTETGSMATGRYLHTATLLPNGQVLVAGGGNFPGGILSSAELYESAP